MGTPLWPMVSSQPVHPAPANVLSDKKDGVLGRKQEAACLAPIRALAGGTVWTNRGYRSWPGVIWLLAFEGELGHGVVRFFSQQEHAVEDAVLGLNQRRAL